MPSAPFSLAAVCACVLALALTSPAQADKDMAGGAAPPAPKGLHSTSAGADKAASHGKSATTPAAHHPVPGGAAGRGNGKGNKGSKNKGTKNRGGKNEAAAPSLKQKLAASTQSTSRRKAGGHNGLNPAGRSVKHGTAGASSASSATPAGGAASGPGVTPGSTPAGSVAAPAKRRHRARRAATHRLRIARASRGAAPRPRASLVTPVQAVPAIQVPAPRPPVRKPRHKRPDHTLSPIRPSVVNRTVHDIVRVIPGPVKAAIAAMAALLLAAVSAWSLVTLRARRLRRQRGDLLREVGLLQAALLPEVPEQIGPLAASVAYRPADGPGAGGDFYDIFQLEDGRVGLVLGDLAGHGREALARTALLRYTLRAYLETGLEPRTAMRLAGETLDHNLANSFATAVVAAYDPDAGKLTYSCAGHPPPILLGPGAHDPIIACSAPPIGVGERTGVRQTTVSLPPGSLACFFTDGLADARVNGELFGRERLVELIAELGGTPSAEELIERIRGDVHHIPDDMAACILRPLGSAAPEHGSRSKRIEELELGNAAERDLRRFFAACGVPPVEIGDLIRSATRRAEDYGGAIVRVKIADGERPHVSLVLPVVEALATASERR